MCCRVQRRPPQRKTWSISQRWPGEEKLAWCRGTVEDIGRSGTTQVDTWSQHGLHRNMSCTLYLSRWIIHLGQTLHHYRNHVPRPSDICLGYRFWRVHFVPSSPAQNCRSRSCTPGPSEPSPESSAGQPARSLQTPPGGREPSRLETEGEDTDIWGFWKLWKLRWLTFIALYVIVFICFKI